MLGIVANDAHDALAVDHLAFITHLFYRRSHFHLKLPLIEDPCCRSGRDGFAGPTLFGPRSTYLYR